MFDTVVKRLTDLIADTYGSLATDRVFYPDADVDWSALATDNGLFIRIRPPQLARSEGLINAFACYIDVCHREFRLAKREADKLIAVLAVPNQRFPSTTIQPSAYPVKESGYWRVTVGFTQTVKYADPTP